MYLIDCTLRDGGYYNNWDFPISLIEKYLVAMRAAKIDFVELGFRTTKSSSKYLGPCAYTTDEFIDELNIPEGLRIGVMINASDVLDSSENCKETLEKLFRPSPESKVHLVRIACHFHEVESVVWVFDWLKRSGYQTGLNLMQITEREDTEIEKVASLATKHPIDVLYFADSLGSMNGRSTAEIIEKIRRNWNGALGIHAHDNMSMAISNSIKAVEKGVSWVDGTVTGMGRGPGNAQIEHLLAEFGKEREANTEISPLLELIEEYFTPMKKQYGWGTNFYYYIAGKYGIHPSFVQEMLSDPRFSHDDKMAVIDHLQATNASSFSSSILEFARNIYHDNPDGNWNPSNTIGSREVLILGAGKSLVSHKLALESFIKKNNPLVIGLNNVSILKESSIALRVACHPIRIIADSSSYSSLPQPLVTPASKLPKEALDSLADKEILDFGLKVEDGVFLFNEQSAVVPSPVVVAYALAVATSGGASKILLAGIDGFSSEDPRQKELDMIFRNYIENPDSIEILSITKTRCDIPESSVYAI